MQPGNGNEKDPYRPSRLIVRVLSSVVLSDMNDFEFENGAQEQLWKEIEQENKFRKGFEEALKEALYIGDGAYKVTIDTSVSQYPILEWYPGEQIEIIRQRGRLREVIFKKSYEPKESSMYLTSAMGMAISSTNCIRVRSTLI